MSEFAILVIGYAVLFVVENAATTAATLILIVMALAAIVAGVVTWGLLQP